ncbi:hypothetical protein SLA2020_099770 [Shorea laevis]
MQRETENTQLAFFTFKDSQGADTASLLTGATIAHLSVTITPVEGYQLPSEALPLIMETKLAETDSTVKKAEDMVSTMLAKGFVLGKDAINKAKVFDEQHQLTSNASATVASIDRKMGLSEKLSIGTAVKASSAGSVIMSNRYVSAGPLWFSNAFSAVAKAAEDVSVMTKEKVERLRRKSRKIFTGREQRL